MTSQFLGGVERTSNAVRRNGSTPEQGKLFLREPLAFHSDLEQNSEAGKVTKTFSAEKQRQCVGAKPTPQFFGHSFVLLHMCKTVGTQHVAISPSIKPLTQFVCTASSLTMCGVKWCTFSLDRLKNILQAREGTTSLMEGLRISSNFLDKAFYSLKQSFIKEEKVRLTCLGLFRWMIRNRILVHVRRNPTPFHMHSHEV